MKSYLKITLYLFLFFSCCNCFSQPGWIQQISSTTDSLRCVKFRNALTGWTAGTNGTILKTTTGGIIWNKINPEINNDFYSICIVSDSVLFVCGENGMILKSENSGNNWTTLSSGITIRLNSIYFVNSNTGYASGFNGTVIKTTNSGNKWNELNTGTDIQLNSIFFTGSLKGWIAGFGGIFHTTNGGLSWSPQFIDGYLVLNSIFFRDSLHGWSAYYDNLTFGPENIRTTTGGLDWINYSMNNSYSISLFFVDNNTGWSSGYYGQINFSTDGGISWISQSSGSPEHLNSVYFTDPLTGWITGNSGTILKTTTGGILTGFTNHEINFPGNFYVSQNYPNPFNPSTTFSYYLPLNNFVSLKIYDILGNEAAVAISKFQNAGNYKIVLNASELPAGIYFYRFTSGKYSESGKMLLVK